MESQPQNPEFRINPENFHPCGLRDKKGNLMIWPIAICIIIKILRLGSLVYVNSLTTGIFYMFFVVC